jgi:putative membrane protein
MKFIIDILKGCVMGIANVIPGVSGGTMAVSMGIYDRLITALTHLFKEFKKSFVTVLPIGIGMVIGILGLSRLIEWMFGIIPVQTNLFFIGLILGGLPMMIKEVKGKKVNAGCVVGFILFFLLVVGLALLDGIKGTDADLSFSILTELKLFGVGVVAAATMVIPGVSGSMMLMLMGYYEPVISAINSTVDALRAMDMDGLMSGILILAPLGIGVVVGIFVIAKIIEWLFNKFATVVYWCIIGLIAASPIAIIIMNHDIFAGMNAVVVITAVIALAVGCVIAYFLGGDVKKEKADGAPANE